VRREGREKERKNFLAKFLEMYSSNDQLFDIWYTAAMHNICAGYYKIE
jgi:hypothetical protein